jgi:sulfur transfer protein SufE
MSEEEILEIEDKLKYLLQISETVSITDDELKPLLETIPISENELKSFLEVPEDKLKYLLEVPKSIPITEDDLKSFLEVPEDKLSYLLKISETVPKIISKLTDNELILNFVDKVEEISELSPNLSDDEIRHLSECAIQEVLANLNEIPWNNK